MLRVADIVKSYADRVLFANLSFDIGDRDRIALIGPNGSGKNDIIRYNRRRDPPDSGQVIKKQRWHYRLFTTGHQSQFEKPITWRSGECL